MWNCSSFSRFVRDIFCQPVEAANVSTVLTVHRTQWNAIRSIVKMLKLSPPSFLRLCALGRGCVSISRQVSSPGEPRPGLAGAQDLPLCSHHESLVLFISGGGRAEGSKGWKQWSHCRNYYLWWGRNLLDWRRKWQHYQNRVTMKGSMKPFEIVKWPIRW